MKRFAPACLGALVAVSVSGSLRLAAEDRGELIFADDFDRSESQELRDEPGKGWGTNSRSRAKGNKQVDLRDGAMHIFIHAEADHAVSVTQPTAFTDGSVRLRFKLEDAKDQLGLNFADLDFKGVHAGHLFAVRIETTRIVCQDLKTGNMRIDIRKARQAKKALTDEQATALVGKEKSFPLATATGEWHEVVVSVKEDELTVTINGGVVGRFVSRGIAHATKRLLRLSVPRNAIVDDVQIRRVK